MTFQGKGGDPRRGRGGRGGRGGPGKAGGAEGRDGRAGRGGRDGKEKGGRRGPPRGVVRLDWPGVYQGPKGVLTKNPSPGVRVYGERLIPHRDGELRAWNPRRSKLAALILSMEGTPFFVRGDERVLYLGAASGTTVSHVSDIVQKGRVVAVEKSPRSFRDLLNLARARANVDPVLSDARDPDPLVAVAGGPVDLLYQDVAQRDQDEIFAKNALRFLRPGGRGVMIVKARSVSVAREPEEVYDAVADHLGQKGLQVTNRVSLEPWEKDHAALIVQRRQD